MSTAELDAPFDTMGGEPVAVGPLSDKERERLALCESIFKGKVHSYAERGKAIRAIRDERLYRETHATFDAYCRDRLEIGRSRAYQLIDASDVVENLSTTVDKPATESQARPLSQLSPEQQREAWQYVLDSSGGKPTTPLVQKIVDDILAGEEPDPKPKWDRVARKARLERLISRELDDWPEGEKTATAAPCLRALADFLDGSTTVALIEEVPTEGTDNPSSGRDTPFIYGSVCSGIEAATVAWEPFGWKAAWFAEVAEFPSAVLAHRYPSIPNHGDFTTIGEDHGPIDLLVGGTPCQSFSVNGLRGGLADERGNLALEYLRLAQRLRPRWLVWENVPGVLSIDEGRAFGSFIGGLEELGYGWAYRVLDARHFGVPQRRRRVFVVGYLGDPRPAICALFERESLSENPRKARAEQKEAARGTRRHAPSLFGADECDRPGDGADAADGGRGLIYGWNGDEEFKYTEGISTTLRAAQGGEGNGFATDDVVRNYTGVERERLMGFPDDWTRVPFRGQLAEKCPNKAREHALGNSMAVPCVAWIGRRIDAIRMLLEAHTRREG